MQLVGLAEVAGGLLVAQPSTRKLGGAVLAATSGTVLNAEMRHSDGELGTARAALLIAALTVVTTPVTLMLLARAALYRDRREGEDTAAIERTFTPEFRNRLDAIISFAPLSREVVVHVVEKFVLQLEAQLMDRNVHIELTPEAADWLAEKGYDDRMGARPLGRVIQEHIKKPLAEELLRGRQLTEGAVRAAMDAELAAAQPQPGVDGGNGFKIPLANRTVVATLRELAPEASR